MIKKYVCIAVVLMFFFSACEKSDPEIVLYEDELIIETDIYDVQITLDGDRVVMMEKYQDENLVEKIELIYQLNNTVEKNTYQGEILAYTSLFHLNENEIATSSDEMDHLNNENFTFTYEYENGFLISRERTPGTWDDKSYNIRKYTNGSGGRKTTNLFLCCPLVGSIHVPTLVYSSNTRHEMKEDIIFYENNILGHRNEYLPSLYVDDYYEEGSVLLNKYSYEMNGDQVAKKTDERYDRSTRELLEIQELNYSYIYQ